VFVFGYWLDSISVLEGRGIKMIECLAYFLGGFVLMVIAILIGKFIGGG
jgi:hypothetical protein